MPGTRRVLWMHNSMNLYDSVRKKLSSRGVDEDAGSERLSVRVTRSVRLGLRARLAGHGPCSSSLYSLP